jgi:prevent-host-death family protein
MKRLNVVELKNSLGDILNRAEYQGERIIVNRRGKDSAAIISIGDLRLFERLLEEAEDRADLEAARAALAESDDRIPYEEFRRRQGLSDEPTSKKQRASSKAGTKAL